LANFTVINEVFVGIKKPKSKSYANSEDFFILKANCSVDRAKHSIFMLDSCFVNIFVHRYGRKSPRGVISRISISPFPLDAGAQCLSEPKAPANGRLSCSSNACQVSCLPDYKFPNGESTLILGCMSGRWMVKSFEWNDIPACERNYCCFDPRMKIA
jgi:hypothetical protein